MLDDKDRELYNLQKAEKAMQQSGCKTDKEVSDKIASIKAEKEKPKDGGEKGKGKK